MGLSVAPPVPWSWHPPGVDATPTQHTQATHYELLGVSRHASASVLRTAYGPRRQHLTALARQGDETQRARACAAVRALDAAATVLLDPGRRDAYDATIGTVAQKAQAAPVLSRAERAQEAFAFSPSTTRATTGTTPRVSGGPVVPTPLRRTTGTMAPAVSLVASPGQATVGVQDPDDLALLHEEVDMLASALQLCFSMLVESLPSRRGEVEHVVQTLVAVRTRRTRRHGR